MNVPYFIPRTIKYHLCYLFVFNAVISYGQLSNRIDSLAMAYVNQGFNGNILYSKNDSIVFMGSYGYSNMEMGKSLNANTLFDLASCSKQFTAVSIIQLIEKGLLSYHTKVNDIIEGFPYTEITIDHLLRHQSGLPKFQNLLYDKKYWNRKHAAQSKDVLRLLSELNLDLRFIPGTKYEYSNTGYVILSVIIEKLSGQTYRGYVEHELFQKAGMDASQVQPSSQYQPDSQNLALGYTLNKRKDLYQKVEIDKDHKHINWMSNVVGGRGIFTSIIDLEKWKQSIRYNKLISEDNKKRMFTPDSISSKYGYGFAIYNTQSKGKWVYHNGSWSGYKTMTLYLPETNEYLVILSNNRFEETYNKMEEDLYNLIL